MQDLAVQFGTPQQHRFQDGLQMKNSYVSAHLKHFEG
jgi:hypothetical protein